MGREELVVEASLRRCQAKARRSKAEAGLRDDCGNLKEALRADRNQMPIHGENGYDLVKGEREDCKTGKQTHQERKFSQQVQQFPVS